MHRDGGSGGGDGGGRCLPIFIVHLLQWLVHVGQVCTDFEILCQLDSGNFVTLFNINQHKPMWQGCYAVARSCVYEWQVHTDLYYMFLSSAHTFLKWIYIFLK